MQLTINDQPQTFISMQTFRAQWALPDEFQIDYFEPKDWSGLGSMSGSGPALALMKETVLSRIPDRVTVSNLLPAVELLAHTFRYQLEIANRQIGLRLHDVGFAVAGFEDVMRGVVYDLLRLKHTCQSDLSQICQNFNFMAVYNQWLNDSVRLSTQAHRYQHQNQIFEVYIVNHVYGRIGLKVSIASETYYVTDKSLACPGEHYMAELCQAVSEMLCARLE